MTAVSYPCGCLLRQTEGESRFCGEALRLLGEAISAHEDLMDRDLGNPRSGGNDDLPKDADFRLDEHWALQERAARKKTKKRAEGGDEA